MGQAMVVIRKEGSQDPGQLRGHREGRVSVCVCAHQQHIKVLSGASITDPILVELDGSKDPTPCLHPQQIQPLSLLNPLLNYDLSNMYA